MQREGTDLFKGSLIGMIHLLPLPGVPGHSGMQRLVRAALQDAEALMEGGADALMIENMHDFPCVRESEMGPEVAAAMTRVGTEVRHRVGPDVPLGIQVLFAANRTAVAVAKASDLDFLRVEGWSYGHLADKGWVEASAGTVVRYRRQIDAEGLLILADVRKKHAAHAATGDLDLGAMASNLELQRADAVVVTGRTTGDAPELEDLRVVRDATQLPVVIGSGIDPRNLGQYRGLWDALIVGSSLKPSGRWWEPVDARQVRRLVEAIRR